uniref:Tropomodulin n=1 Tax=Romanomermis culicivorax TaxID=13658 RepID=A0A915J4H1_ROMCU
RSAHYDSLEDEVRLRIQFEGLILPAEEEEEEEDKDFLPLSDDQLDLVRRALSNPNAAAVLAKSTSGPITKKDLMTLKGLDWLNDEPTYQLNIDRLTSYSSLQCSALTFSSVRQSKIDRCVAQDSVQFAKKPP